MVTADSVLRPNEGMGSALSTRVGAKVIWPLGGMRKPRGGQSRERGPGSVLTRRPSVPTKPRSGTKA